MLSRSREDKLEAATGLRRNFWLGTSCPHFSSVSKLLYSGKSALPFTKLTHMRNYAYLESRISNGLRHLAHLAKAHWMENFLMFAGCLICSYIRSSVCTLWQDATVAYNSIGEATCSHFLSFHSAQRRIITTIALKCYIIIITNATQKNAMQQSTYDWQTHLLFMWLMKDKSIQQVQRLVHIQWATSCQSTASLQWCPPAKAPHLPIPLEGAVLASIVPACFLTFLREWMSRGWNSEK